MALAQSFGDLASLGSLAPLKIGAVLFLCFCCGRYFGLTPTRFNLVIMGYYRSLYAGPVIRVKKPTAAFTERVTNWINSTPMRPRKGERIELFRYIDFLDEEFTREDSLEFLQRHVGGQGLLAPSHLADQFEKKFGRELSVEVKDDPEYVIESAQIEEEKSWLAANHVKELEILRAAFDTVEITWAVVMDGG